MAFLRLNVRKKLHTAEGMQDLSVALEIDKDEFVAFSGPSGAGKTTVLRMIAGLTDPDEGTVACNGAIWFESARVNVPPQKRNVGFMFQDYALFPTMSVRKNIEYGLCKGADRSRVDFLLETFQLKGLEKRIPGHLSGGQQQRVALARALAPEPRLLLLDEPLSALDPDMRLSLQEELLRAHKEFPIPTIMVSHDVVEMRRLCSRVIFLKNGAVECQGKPAEILKVSAVS
jgi:molybdate transport system ATP-binding protein